MLSNAYFLAKFRFDTAENEPAKNLQNFRKMHFRSTRNCARPAVLSRGKAPGPLRLLPVRLGADEVLVHEAGLRPRPWG